MDMMTMVQRLTAVYGISGREAAVAEEIRRMAEPYADEIWTDRLGNLICHKKGEGPKVMFAAHLDSIGLIVTHIESAGFLRVAKIGGVRPEKILHSLVRFENGTIGTIASSGTDLGKLSMEDLYVDIGAESREEAEKKVSVGDAAVYMGQPVQTGTTLFSPYLDDRLGCVILLKTMELAADSPNDLYFVFTVQEEVGLCGAHTAAHGIVPDYGIAVDVTCTDDVPGSRHTVSAALGKGAGIKVMDGSLMCHGAVVERLKELAAGNGIPVQARYQSHWKNRVAMGRRDAE